MIEKDKAVYSKLSPKEVSDNKKAFIELLKSVQRKGMDELIDWLQRSDFFEAPASVRYHSNYIGGLAEHSLNVYKNLVMLYGTAKANDYTLEKSYGTHIVEGETLILAALLHDICKANFYSVTSRNVKNEETGAWEKVPVFTYDDAYPMGHGEKSLSILQDFIRLTDDEKLAIRWHMGAFDSAVKGGDSSISKAFEKYPLCVLLHTADMWATYFSESEDE